MLLFSHRIFYASLFPMCLFHPQAESFKRSLLTEAETGQKISSIEAGKDEAAAGGQLPECILCRFGFSIILPFK